MHFSDLDDIYDSLVIHTHMRTCIYTSSVGTFDKFSEPTKRSCLVSIHGWWHCYAEPLSWCFHFQCI